MSTQNATQTATQTATEKTKQAPAETERSRALTATLADIEKQFGKGAIMRLGTGEATVEVPVIPTGSLGLDIALGTGGLPRGRVIEVYGPGVVGEDDAGAARRRRGAAAGGICAFIDAEHALDVGYARKLGVRTEELLVSQPDCGEQALEIAEMLVALGRRRPHRDRLGRGAGAEGGDRGGDGRRAHGPAGAAHEPGAAQADRRDRQEATRWSSSSTSCA